MAEHTLKISRDNYIWYYIPDGKFSTYLITFQQDFVYNDGDTVKIGAYAGFKVDAPTKPYYFRLENTDRAACQVYATAHDMSLADVTGPTPHLDTSPLYERKGRYNTVYYKGTSTYAFFLHGVGSNGTTWPTIPPVCLFEDADGKLFTWDQGPDYGDNSVAAGQMNSLGTTTLPRMYMAGNYYPAVTNSGISSVYEACVPGPGEVDPLLIKRTDSYTWETLTYDRENYFTFVTLIGDKPAFTPRLLSDFQQSDAGKSMKQYLPNGDPYGDDDDGAGGFGGSGGDGSREKWDDSITTPDLPSLSIGDLGSMGIFTPSTAQLQSFFKYLWSDAFSVDGFKKILSDPMQAIVSLHALPCSVKAGSSAEVAFGNIATGVSMPRVSSEWLTVDCGSIPFKKYYGSFFDYSPYTKYQIFLPYIGYKDISPDDFVGGSCHVVYHVHVPSGALMCYLLSSAVDSSVLYQYGGSCLMQLPITSGTYNNFVGSILTGIASGAAALGNISSVAGKVASGALSAAASASSAVASLGSVLSSKPTVSRSGTISGAAGWMARQVPYVIRTRPNAVLTENLNSFQGYPLYRSRTLSQMSGYTVVDDIHLSGLSATSDEAEEIERLLKEGVIF